jgi:hypothetical protein
MRMERATAACMSMLLSACSTTRYSTPVDADELESLVLVIRETPEGQLTHSWQKASEFDLGRHQSQTRNDSVAGRLVPAAWTRDCDQELVDCHRNCMRRPVPPRVQPIRVHPQARWSRRLLR